METVYVLKGRNDEHRVCTLSQYDRVAFSKVQLTLMKFAARAKRRTPCSTVFVLKAAGELGTNL